MSEIIKFRERRNGGVTKEKGMREEIINETKIPIYYRKE